MSSFSVRVLLLSVSNMTTTFGGTWHWPSSPPQWPDLVTLTPGPVTNVSPRQCSMAPWSRNAMGYRHVKAIFVLRVESAFKQV